MIAWFSGQKWQKSEKRPKIVAKEKMAFFLSLVLSHRGLSQWLNGNLSSLIGRDAALCEGVYALSERTSSLSLKIRNFFKENIYKKILSCNFEHFLCIFCMRKMPSFEDVAPKKCPSQERTTMSQGVRGDLWTYYHYFSQLFAPTIFSPSFGTFGEFRRPPPPTPSETDWGVTSQREKKK